MAKHTTNSDKMFFDWLYWLMTNLCEKNHSDVCTIQLQYHNDVEKENYH